jgi:hypothetical protein
MVTSPLYVLPRTLLERLTCSAMWCSPTCQAEFTEAQRKAVTAVRASSWTVVHRGLLLTPHGVLCLCLCMCLHLHLRVSCTRARQLWQSNRVVSRKRRRNLVAAIDGAL